MAEGRVEAWWGIQPKRIKDRAAGIRKREGSYREVALRAMQGGDLGELTEYIADDAVWISPEHGYVTGADDILRTYEQTRESYEVKDLSIEPREVRVSGNTVWVEGQSRVEAVDKKSGETTTYRLNYVNIWERDSERNWKIVRNIWNGIPEGVDLEGAIGCA